MNSYKSTYDYKDDILETLKKYNPIIHTNKEKEYNWLNDKECRIEIPNRNGNSLFIDLESEITITYDNWHNHYYYEDKYDIDNAIEKVKNILNNKDCIISIFINNKCFGCGSSLNKEKYTEQDSIEFIKSFIKGTPYDKLKQYGATIKVTYWNSSKNYEIKIEKEKF